MNPSEPDPLSEWLKHRREEPVPRASDSFSDSVLDAIDPSTRRHSPSIGIRLLQIAAIIAVAAVGILRLELFSQLILQTL